MEWPKILSKRGGVRCTNVRGKSSGLRPSEKDLPEGRSVTQNTPAFTSPEALYKRVSGDNICVGRYRWTCSDVLMWMNMADALVT
jgi:hypothetical protein